MLTSSHDDADAGELLDFAPEAPPPTQDVSPPQSSWKVLAVDDDPDFQRATAYALNHLEWQGRPVVLQQAFNIRDAAQLLTGDHDIAVVLLDVVMESDDAGLRLVRSIRETLGNAEVRIILVTGQPGMAPLRDTMAQLDINDYWSKTELSVERLHTVVTANLRSWEHISEIARARRGLQLIIESSNLIIRARSPEDFSRFAVEEIANILEIPPAGIVCAVSDDSKVAANIVIGAVGQYVASVGKAVETLDYAEAREALLQCISEQGHVSLPSGHALYFDGTPDGIHHAAYIPINRPLSDTEVELVGVFTTNIQSGFRNLALVSKLDHLAYFDPLFDLPNRNALLRQLSALQDGNEWSSNALLLTHVDDFTTLSLAVGIGRGEAMLNELVERLKGMVDATVMVARLYDDVFALLGKADVIEQVQSQQLSQMQARDFSNGHFVSLSSVRMNLSDFSGSPEAALFVASLLLSDAKKRGFRQHEVYIAGMELESAARFQQALELRDALEQGYIGIDLQPQVELATGKIIGAEALARWRPPSGEAVSPGVFIPVAEATGLIIPLGEHVLRLAARAARILQEGGMPGIRIAVNVSAPQLIQDDVVPRMVAILEEEGASPGQIEVELTESLAMQGYEVVRRRLQEFRDAGFEVAIDDFGTGFSSLSYLRHLPANRLKIDRAFVDEIGRVKDESAIAGMILRIARSLGLQVVAEGVENGDQVQWLGERGCDHIQGFHFAKPMELQRLIDWLKGMPTLSRTTH